MSVFKSFFTIVLWVLVSQSSTWAQNLKIKFPNGGENFPLNETRPIAWSSDKINTSIKILLIDKNLNKIYVIEDSYNINPEWTYNWKVGTVKSGGLLTPGNQFIIRIQTIDNKYSDESDQLFTISVAKKIKITNPTKVNVWSLKSHRLITWENTGNLSGSVRLILNDKNSSHSYTIKENIPIASKKYGWTVGETLNNVNIDPGQYRIKIQTMDKQYEDQTDLFSLTSQTNYSLNPDIFNYWWYSRYRWRNPLCGSSLDSKGVAPEDVAADKMRVGFDNFYNSGFCEKYYLGHLYRGFLTFDLSSVKGTLVKATLLLTRQSTVKSVGSYASNVGSCGGNINILDAPISGFYSTGHFYDQILQNQGTTAHGKYDGGSKMEIDVTTVVKEWLEGKKPNDGFMFVGPNESFSHNNDACVTIYSPVVLSLEMQSFI